MSSLPSGTVTFLFTDIEGSTKLWEQYPEAMKSALAKHDSTLKEAIESNNGQIIKTTGDGVHAVFSTAIDAVKAALEAQKIFQISQVPVESDISIRVRMGIHTGEAELRSGDYYGGTLNRAARIMSVGHGGQILISEITHQIAQEHLSSDISLFDLGEHRLKGIAAPERIYQLCYPDLIAEFPTLNSLAFFKHNLQRQLSTFIGREKELADIKQLLKNTQLLTLLGPGGTGKTRLTLQVAEEVIEDYPDGVWLVELAPLTDPDLIPERVAAALNIQEQPGRSIFDTLTDYLRRKELLLILDNVEHLVRESAAFTEHLLKKCPKLKILVTGREALFIGGETTIQTPSLSLPQVKQSPEEIAKSEGVQLFLERARSVRPEFELTPQNAGAIAEIIRRLDGIPLAIELAASRMRMLTVEQIAERLNDRFRLLTGGRRTALPRQQTLEALIDWSWQLLDESERILLRRLSVFSGGWTLESAQGIAGFDPLDEFAVFDLLDQLINKSLVAVEYPETSEARYRMLESIRQFAQDKLVEANESETLRDRHAEYFVAFSVKAGEEMYSKDALVWIERLRRELDNQRVVIEWTQNDQPELTLRLLGHLRHNRGHWLNPREAETWFNSVMPRFRELVGQGSDDVNMEDYINALLALTMNELILGRNTTTREIADEAVNLARLHKYDRLLAASIAIKGLTYAMKVDTAFIQEMEETAQLCRQKGYSNELTSILLILIGVNIFYLRDTEKGGQCIEELKKARLKVRSPLSIAQIDESLNGLAMVTIKWSHGETPIITGDLEAAKLSTLETIKIFEKLGARQNAAMARSRLGHIFRYTGDFQGAKDIYRKTIYSWQELGNFPAVAHQVECFAFLAVSTGNYQRGAILIGAARATREQLNAQTENPLEITDMKQAITQLTEAIGDEERDRLMAEGAKMSLDEAVLLALEDSDK